MDITEWCPRPCREEKCCGISQFTREVADYNIQIYYLKNTKILRNVLQRSTVIFLLLLLSLLLFMLLGNINYRFQEFTFNYFIFSNFLDILRVDSSSWITVHKIFRSHFQTDLKLSDFRHLLAPYLPRDQWVLQILAPKTIVIADEGNIYFMEQRNRKNNKFIFRMHLNTVSILFIDKWSKCNIVTSRIMIAKEGKIKDRPWCHYRDLSNEWALLGCHLLFTIDTDHLI